MIGAHIGGPILNGSVAGVYSNRHGDQLLTPPTPHFALVSNHPTSSCVRHSFAQTWHFPQSFVILPLIFFSHISKRFLGFFLPLLFPSFVFGGKRFGFFWGGAERRLTSVVRSSEVVFRAPQSGECMPSPFTYVTDVASPQSRSRAPCGSIS